MKKMKNDHQVPETNVTLRVGDVVANSWGYDMTIVDFAQIIAISPSGKSVKARRISGKTVSGDSGYTGRVAADPDAEAYGPEFRLMVRTWKYTPNDTRVLLVGSYPFAMGSHHRDETILKNVSTHSGTFEAGRENETHHFNSMD